MTKPQDARLFNPDPARPMRFLQHCPAYQPSPLREINDLWVKDETARMGLGAFKALGGVYAVAQILSERMGVPPENLLDHKAQAAQTTFVTASAGNHGIAVAAGAVLFGAKSRIHLADTVPEEFAERLKAKGAEVSRSGPTYETSIKGAIKDAENTGALHLADGSWPGYTERPALIMEGYSVIAEELRQEFETRQSWPDHVYLQAGVGGLAAAMAAMIRKNWHHQPHITVVEPNAAPCLKASVAAGRLQTVTGPISNMGRLDCKDASLLAFDTLKRDADSFVTITDTQADAAVTHAQSLGFETTASGAAGLAAHLSTPHKNALVILSEGSL